MAGNGPINAYCDVPTFLMSAPGISPSAGLLGANARLTTASLVGATSLTVDTSIGVTPGQYVFVLDGPNTEIVRADVVNPTPTGTTITILAPGTQLAHAIGTNITTGGSRGALGQLILQASGWVENFCQQGVAGDRGLFSVARTEKLRMPSTRAKIDPWQSLSVRPRHFPITAITTVSLEWEGGAAQSYDLSTIEIDASARSFVLPQFKGLTNPGSIDALYGPPLLPGDQGWCNVTYTAGFTWPNLPWDFQTAVMLAVQEFMAYQQNPTGAALVKQGDVMIQQRLRGSGGKESSINGLFLSQATVMLQSYRNMFV